ncbi:MAG: hypothetical protein Q4F18_05585 [Clostridia bacterium]|nr:hypothetical protein [Clostridia bacterium]
MVFFIVFSLMMMPPLREISLCFKAKNIVQGIDGKILTARRQHRNTIRIFMRSPFKFKKARRARSHFRTPSHSKVFLCPLSGFSRHFLIKQKARRARSYFRNPSHSKVFLCPLSGFSRHFLIKQKARRARSYFRNLSHSEVFLCPLPGFSRHFQQVKKSPRAAGA